MGAIDMVMTALDQLHPNGVAAAVRLDTKARAEQLYSATPSPISTNDRAVFAEMTTAPGVGPHPSRPSVSVEQPRTAPPLAQPRPAGKMTEKPIHRNDNPISSRGEHTARLSPQEPDRPPPHDPGHHPPQRGTAHRGPSASAAPLRQDRFSTMPRTLRNPLIHGRRDGIRRRNALGTASTPRYLRTGSIFSEGPGTTSFASENSLTRPTGSRQGDHSPDTGRNRSVGNPLDHISFRCIGLGGGF